MMTVAKNRLSVDLAGAADDPLVRAARSGVARRRVRWR